MPILIEQEVGRFDVTMDDALRMGVIEAPASLKEDGQELFVHKSALDGGYLNEGERVEFEIGEGRKGPIAENVKVL